MHQTNSHRNPTRGRHVFFSTCYKNISPVKAPASTKFITTRVYHFWTYTRRFFAHPPCSYYWFKEIKKYDNEMSSTGIIIIQRVVVAKPAKNLQREGPDTQRRRDEPKVIFISDFRCVGTISKRDCYFSHVLFVPPPPPPNATTECHQRWYLKFLLICILSFFNLNFKFFFFFRSIERKLKFH